MQEIGIRHGSRMANRLLQYLTARALAAQIPKCRVTGHEIDEWSLRGDPCGRGHRRWPKLDIQRVDIPWLIQAIDSGQVPSLKITAVSSDVDLLPTPAKSSSFIDAGDAPFYATGPGDVVIHIRLEDIMEPGRHVGYGPLPLAYYREIIEETGLHPVFVGQFGDDVYSAALKSAFPDATILEGGSVLHDFQTIRNAHNVILGISTFSWLAAWLGAKARIFYPLKGMLDPRLYPQINLLPANDDRFDCRSFPGQPWTASADEIEALISGPSRASPIDAATVTSIREAAADAARDDIDDWRDRFAQVLEPQRLYAVS